MSERGGWFPVSPGALRVPVSPSPGARTGSGGSGPVRRPLPRCGRGEGGEDVVVPEAEHAPAAAGEPCRAALVGASVGVVLAAVGFDDEAVAGAGEIDDEGADRVPAAGGMADQSVTDSGISASRVAAFLQRTR